MRIVKKWYEKYPEIKVDEVVHHKDENTLNNDISNLQLMSAVEHIKHHITERKRNNDGKFKI